jgi:hypothetical protein
MGKELNEGVVNELEELLGLSDNVIHAKDDNNNPALDADVVVSPEPTVTTTTFVQDQNALTKDIIKLDLQIEELRKSHVDTTDFYDHLDAHLSEEEQALEFDNKSAYMKVIAQKVKEYEEKHSSKGELEKLEAQKSELESVYERSTAVMAVSAKYPDFNYENVHSFFENKLNKEQQAEVYAKSASYSDVYENAYKLFVEANPSNIKNQKSPNIPNLNNVRKQNIADNTIDDGFTSDDEKLRAALGI